MVKKWIVWIIPVAVVCWLLILAVQEDGLSWPPSLDFTGGTRLEYRIDKEDATRKGIETSDELKEALERSQEVFLFRLRGFDLSEVTVKPKGHDRLVVEVPGTEAIERVKEEIGNAGVLTFRLILETFSGAEKLSQLTEDVRQNCFRYDNEDIYFEVGEPLLDASDISYKGTRVEKAPASLENPGGGIYIRLELKPKSKSKFADLTNKHFQKSLAVCLDNKVVSALRIADRNIREPIITGEFTATEAKELVKILRAGPLPVSLNLTSQVLVSPSLGRKTFHRGLIALAVGMCFVVLLLGLGYIDHVAMLVTFVVCMTLEGVLLFIFGRIGLLTLNMVSLSGLVVLIGISVDNLILIFEEFRTIQLGEQVYTLKDSLSSLGKAFKRERKIIILANGTTIATLLPLYFLQGPIKDLVAIMILGIIIAVGINFFYAGRLLASREFVFPLESISRLHRPWLRIRFPLFSISRYLLVLYLAVVAGSVVLLASRGLERGLDFKGGTEIMLFSDQGIGTDNLRSYASDYLGERCEVKRVKDRYSGDHVAFQYIIRIPRGERLLASRSGQERADDGETSIVAELTAEELVKYLNSKVSTSIRIGSVDILGSTVVAMNRRVVIFSILVGLLSLIVIIGVNYGGGYPIPVIAALILDGIIVLGAISLFRVPMSIAVVAAILTVIGYSINDSIVICGHVHREIKETGMLERESFKSMLELLSSRVVLTSVTTAGVAASLWIFGEGLIRDFGLVITVGTIFGTLSSISLVVMWLERVSGKHILDSQSPEDELQHRDNSMWEPNS